MQVCSSLVTDLLQEGEDLHTFWSDVFHYGISWTPSAMEQRIGRVDRVRSLTAVSVPHPDLKPGEATTVYIVTPSGLANGVRP